MGVKPFTGELDAPASLKPFTGELDAPEQPASIMDKLIGGRGGRALIGMASPLIASAQLGAQVGDAINTATGVEPVVSPWIDAKLKDLEASKQRGMKALGNEGFDAYGLIGSLIPGAAIAKGVANALPAATGALGRIGTGAAIGAATSAAQPIESSPDFFTDKAKQVGIGGAIGGAIPAVGEAFRAARGAPNLNPTTAATLAEGQKEGYVISPSTVNPSFLNNKLESIAGKAAVGQDVAHRNQDISTLLAKRQMRLPSDTPLNSEDVFDTVRQQHWKPYEDIAALGPEAKDSLETLKQARFMRNLHLTSFDRTGNSADYLKSQEFKKTIDEMEKHLGDMATAEGKPELMQQLPEARKAIAKTYDIQRAWNEGTGDIAAGKIAKNKRVTEELATIRKMALAFPSAMREGSRVPTPGVSGTDAAAAALLAVGGAAGGGPMGALAGALPLLRGPARNLVLSPAYQKFATSDPSKYQAIIDALAQQGAGAAGTTAGRMQP